MLFYNLRESLEDNKEAAGKVLFLARSDGAAGDKAKPCPLLINDTVASNSGTGVNPNNPYWLGLLVRRLKTAYDRASMISSGISKLAWTF
jgi:hypothetical protein